MVYLYHLYHHDLSEPLDHDLISTLGKGQNNVHENGQPSQSYRIEPVPTKIH
jgi:hypothetical protein